mgnify:CR=1 FL=1|tara:strand:- start:561 stop:785 length:225 start_codon:yes stop_codon:yes gene_type:complete
MPIYEYKCTCGKQFDVKQSMNDEKLTKCDPEIHDCEENGSVTRLMGKPLILSDDIGRGVKRMTDKKLYKELDID